MQNPTIEIVVTAHQALTQEQLGHLRSLFDHEYLMQHGDWDPELPYDYAPHDVHVVAVAGNRAVGHVGWARRTITVGTSPVTIAGVGGVLVAPALRGRHLGRRLMDTARQSMLRTPGIDFGYLGCAEAVAPFYASCGWHRITAPERRTNRDDEIVDSPAGQPLFVLPVGRPAGSWPPGLVDLRGRPW